jgi:low temperature requirement protein LtrA
MHGMELQEYWSVRAASAAVLGLSSIFAVWWWYFDRIQATGERFVRSRREALRFHVWSYAHLPFYLAIAVTGVGFEHIIATSTTAPMHAAELGILGGAIVLLAGALAVIGGAGDS